MRRLLIAIAIALALVSPAVFAGGTAFWRMDTFTDFARGSFTGISLSRDGKLLLAPRMEEVFTTGQALVWSMAEDSSGNVYLGTGHSGKVFRLDGKDPKGKGREFFDAPEPDVFALAVDKKNNVYAGTSPDGKVYRVSAEGHAEEFFDPKAKYIWSLALDAQGNVYVGTGDRGRIYRVAPDGKGALFFDTQQSHVMTLAVAPDSSLIAGSEPNGLLYRITKEGRGFVLYDAPLAEIHSVAVAADGSVYASAIAAGAQKNLGLAAAAAAGAASEGALGNTTITIRAAPPVDPEGDKKDDKQKQQEKEAAEKAAVAAAAAAAAAAATPVPVIDSSTGLRSAIYRVAPDRTVETVWSSREESVYDILPSAEGLLFSTDERGRVYQLNAEKQTTLLVQTNEEQTTRLVRRGEHVLAATSNFGKLFRVETRPAERGWYESPVHDTRSISRWGKLMWRAMVPPGARVEFFTRAGNSANPDNTWTDWERTGNAGGGRGGDVFEEQVASPPSRYIQWKAVFHGAAAPPVRSALLEEVAVAYLPQNRAPIISSIAVNPTVYVPSLAAAPRPAAAGAITPSTEPMVVIVDDSATPKPATPQVTSSASAAAAPKPGSQPTVIVSWQAEDPDNDRMSFRVFIRGEGESEWRLLKDDVHDTSMQLEPETLPDGKYQVRLVASDAEANPRETARTAAQISAPFLIDNTPPVVKTLAAGRNGATADVRFEVTDAASVLRRAEYSLDGGPWFPIFAEDGIVDSRNETFRIRLDKLAAGEHVVVLRVYDSGSNAGMGKAVLK